MSQPHRVRRTVQLGRPALTAALGALALGTVLQAGLPVSSSAAVATPQVQPVAADPPLTAGRTPYGDTYAVSSVRRTTHGSRSYLFATTSVNRAFVKFDLRSTVPAGYTITGASLKLYVLNISRGAAGFEIHPTTNSWSERSLTAGNRPAYQPRKLNVPYAVK